MSRILAIDLGKFKSVGQCSKGAVKKPATAVAIKHDELPEWRRYVINSFRQAEVRHLK